MDKQIKQNQYYKYIIIVMCVMVLIFAYLIFMYGDLVNTIDNSNILIKAVKERRVLEFYEMSVKYSQTNFAANYNFIIYFIFAIWQLPMYGIVTLLGKDYLSCSWAMLWSKTLIVIFAILVSYYVYKIIKLCNRGEKHALLGIFLYWSSMMVFYPVFICGQLEAISMSFMLCGIYYYLQNNKKVFWICFTLAVPCKMFALLLAFPLIILKEKKILKIIGVWLSMTSLLVVEKILFHKSVIYTYALEAQNKDAIAQLLGSNIYLGRPVVFFVLCYAFIVAYAYITKTLDSKKVIYMCFAVWATFVSFCSINSYWIFLVAPLCIINICVNNQYLKSSILVETIGGFFYFLYVVCGEKIIPAYSNLISNLLLPSVFEIADPSQLKYGNLVNFFQVHGLDLYVEAYSSIFVAAMLVLLVLTFPKQQKEKEKEVDGEILLLRPIVLGVISCLIIYGYSAKTNIIAVDTRNDDAIVSSVDLISDEHTNILEQEIVFNNTRKLEEMILKFNNTLPSRVNMALLYIEIWDGENEKCIFKGVQGCSSIQDNVDIRINLRKVEVQKNIPYVIKLYGVSGNEWYRDTSKLYPYIIVNRTENLKHIKINGIERKAYLYFEIR